MVRHADPLLDLRLGELVRVLAPQAIGARLQRAHRLQQRGLEGAVAGHHLARRLHLGRDGMVGGDEFIERPARDLHHDVVERRLEAGERLLGHGVRNLVQMEADGDLGGDAGDGVAGGLRCQRRRPADARVHLDHVVLGGVRVEGELDVASPFDAKGADDLQRRGPEHLVLFVGKRLARRDDNRVAGMHPHRV